MKRNPFLIPAVLFCLATFAMAAEQKKEALPQSQQTEQMQMARNDAESHMERDSSTKSPCAPKAGKHSMPKHMQDDPEGDPQAAQNQVEYGGGG